MGRVRGPQPGRPPGSGSRRCPASSARGRPVPAGPPAAAPARVTPGDSRQGPRGLLGTETPVGFSQFNGTFLPWIFQNGLALKKKSTKVCFVLFSCWKHCPVKCDLAFRTYPKNSLPHITPATDHSWRGLVSPLILVSDSKALLQD